MPIVRISQATAHPAPILSHPAMLPSNARFCRGEWSLARMRAGLDGR